MNTGDFINSLLFVATLIGAICAYFQIRVLNKQKRADLILQLCNRFYDDENMQEIYYKIEYSEFSYNSTEFHHSIEERQLDTLLGHFDNIAQLFEMRIIEAADLQFIRYEFKTVIENIQVNQYLEFLDGWCYVNDSDLKFKSFRTLGALISQKKI